jgi:uncharacterized membrane protein
MEKFMVGLFWVVIAVILTICMSNRIWKTEAVIHGKAEFYLDNDYNRQWRWLP